MTKDFIAERFYEIMSKWINYFSICVICNSHSYSSYFLKLADCIPYCRLRHFPKWEFSV